jgi:hypothetical protein
MPKHNLKRIKEELQSLSLRVFFLGGAAVHSKHLTPSVGSLQAGHFVQRENLKSTNQTLGADNSPKKAQETKNLLLDCCPLLFILSFVFVNFHLLNANFSVHCVPVSSH